MVPYHPEHQIVAIAFSLKEVPAYSCTWTLLDLNAPNTRVLSVCWLLSAAEASVNPCTSLRVDWLGRFLIDLDTEEYRGSPNQPLILGPSKQDCPSLRTCPLCGNPVLASPICS